MKTKLLLLIFLAPLIVFGQQIGGDIDGEAASDLSGSSVSLNSDGSIVAIGAYNNDGNAPNSGHVRVYQNTGTWSQIGDDIDGEQLGDLFGVCVSLNSNGSIVAIGAQNSNGINGINSGDVRVYEYNGGTWSQIGDDIDGEAAYNAFGYALSLSADGTILAIGAPWNDENGTDSGHVRVYENMGGTWTQMGVDIDGEAAGDEFGSSVSISADGSIVAISAPGNDDNGINSGQVKVYEYMGGTWTHIGDDIDGEAAGDWMGYWNGTLSLSADGNIIAIGAHRNDGNGEDSGHVRVFKNIGGTWTQIGDDINGKAAYDQCGYSVNLSANGSLLAVGIPRNDSNGDDSGKVIFYNYIDGSWDQIGHLIGEAEFDHFGDAISISADEKIVAIGAPWNDGINGANSGHVRAFDLILGLDNYTQIDFSIYPSPTSGILNINSETAISQIEIYNLLGQLVLSFEDTNTIDISSVEQGVYFVKVMDENGNVGSQKVVKK